MLQPCKYSFFSTSIPIFFGLTFLKYALKEIAQFEEQNINYYLISLGIALFLIQTTLCLITIRLGKIISSRIIGPIIGVERYLKDTIKGKKYVFSLRKNDDFKNLEGPLNELNQRLMK